MARLTRCIELLDEGISQTAASIGQLPTMEATLVRLMLLLGDGTRGAMERELKPLQLNDSEFQTLMILYTSAEGSSTPGELCDFTSQRANNMTRIANTLLQRGLITRHHGERDRRQVVLRITAGGRRLVAQSLPPLFPKLDDLFGGFSATDKRTLDRLLRRLAGNLDRLNEQACL